MVQPLSYLHIVIPDLVNLVLQLPGLLVLLPVLLAFQLGGRVQHDVLDLILQNIKFICVCM